MVASGSPSRFALPDGWLDYADWRPASSGVVGRLLVRPGVASRSPRGTRHILALLPPSLDRDEAGDRRYPVLYLHDGQNLFDAGTSNGTEWEIDETMARLAGEGIEAIVVGIPNAEAADPPQEHGRSIEYSPHDHEDRPGGGADDYLAYIVDTVKPLVDAAFPTLAEPAATGIAGSSLGGLISLYALAARPDAFGFAGIVSPALWFADERVLRDHAPAVRPGPRVYIDVGGREGDHLETAEDRDALSSRYVDGARRLRDVLLANGFRDGVDLRYVEDPAAPHHESAWARRSPEMLRFLLEPWRRAER